MPNATPRARVCGADAAVLPVSQREAKEKKEAEEKARKEVRVRVLTSQAPRHFALTSTSLRRRKRSRRKRYVYTRRPTALRAIERAMC